jgi:hypothetical protein
MKVLEMREMRVAVGVVLLLFGVIAFGVSVSSLPPGAPLDYMVGNFIPSGAIIVLGVVVLTWKKKER